MSPTERPFFHQTRVEDGLVVWQISGVLNSDRVEELKTELNRLLDKGLCRFIIDFDGLKAIDSRGLGFLITVQKEARAREGRLAITNLGAQFAPLFELTRLNRILEIFLDMETARRSFGGVSKTKENS